MSEQAEATNVLMLQVIEQVEKRILDRETKRFRILYAMFALVSFVGIGVISQLIELYATRAVEQRLETSRLELDSARIYTQLLALATKLDLSSSFTRTDRDSVMRLLDMAAPNKKLRAEPAFESLLEKILDSFSAAGSDIFVARIYDSYEQECLTSSGISETLTLHFAGRLLQATDRGADTFQRDAKRFGNVSESADTFGHKGLVAALRSLVAFQRADGKRSPELDASLVSYEAFDEDERSNFVRVIDGYSNPADMVKKDNPTAEVIRIAKVGAAFKTVYAAELARLAGTLRN